MENLIVSDFRDARKARHELHLVQIGSQNPRLGHALSECGNREDLLPLGITRMSAGSTTRVGGHTIESPEEQNTPQFEISDPRDVEEMKAMLVAKGYQPVLKDWMQI